MIYLALGRNASARSSRASLERVAPNPTLTQKRSEGNFCTQIKFKLFSKLHSTKVRLCSLMGIYWLCPLHMPSNKTLRPNPKLQKLLSIAFWVVFSTFFSWLCEFRTAFQFFITLFFFCEFHTAFLWFCVFQNIYDGAFFICFLIDFVSFFYSTFILLFWYILGFDFDVCILIDSKEGCVKLQ